MRKLSIIIAVMVIMGAINSCKKSEMTIPPSYAEFTGNTNSAAYFIKNDPNSVFKIPIGITAVANQDRTILLSYASSTGAAQGVQYSAPASIVIPAGKALDSLAIKGLFSGYASGRKDTLVISISGGDVPADFTNNKFTLVLQKYCDVAKDNLIGNYTGNIDYYSGSALGPKYTAAIINWTATGATSASVNIVNLGRYAWGPFAPTDPAISPGVQVTLDWSNPAGFKVTVPRQNYFDDGTGMSVITKGSGSFSACDNTFTINLTVLYAGDGNSYVTTSVLRR